MVDGLKLMGRMFLAAGATRVLPATYAWHEMRTAASLDRLDDYVRDNADLLLTTAHPQGGNPIGPVARAAWSARTSACTASATCGSRTRASSRRASA